MLNNKTLKIVSLIIIILVVVLILFVAIFYFLKIRSNYAAVFLNNGMVYFGRLSTFPKLKLINPIYVQVDQAGNPSLQKFSDSFWQPKGVIYLNKNSISFIAPLKDNSPLINFINQVSLPAPAIFPQQQPLQQSAPTPMPQKSQPTEIIQEPVTE